MQNVPLLRPSHLDYIRMHCSQVHGMLAHTRVLRAAVLSAVLINKWLLFNDKQLFDMLAATCYGKISMCQYPKCCL